MTIILAMQTAVWLTLGIATALFAGITVLAVVGVYLAVIEGGGAIADVQRFKDLTDEARRVASPSSAPSDGDPAATTAAIVRFQAKKDEARRALWASRDAQRAGAVEKVRTAAPSSRSRLVPRLRSEEVAWHR